MKVLPLLLCLSTTFLLAESYSGGAPAQACSTLSPNPSAHGAQPQGTTVNYNLDISQFDDGIGGYCYLPGQPYSLTVRGTFGDQFKGFFIQARLVADDTTRVGTFVVYDSTNTRLSSCTPSTDGITHTHNGNKFSVQFGWTAPAAGTGPIRFGFAIVRQRTTYWANQRTDIIRECVTSTPAVVTLNPVDPNNEGDFSCLSMRRQQSFQCFTAYDSVFTTGVINIAAINSYCASDCAPIVARDYLDCGYTTLGNTQRYGCSRNRNNEYCLAVIGSSSIQTNVGNIIQACSSSTTGCTTACRNALDTVGCCIATEPVASTLSQFLPSGILSRCNIVSCTLLPTAQPDTTAGMPGTARPSDNTGVSMGTPSTTCPDASVQACNDNFMNAISNLASLTQYRSFCSSDCPIPLAKAYQACEDPSSPGQFGVLTSEAICKGCAMDNVVPGRPCGEAVTTPGYNALLIAIISSCSVPNYCSNIVCKSAIQSAGCCAFYGAQTGLVQDSQAQTIMNIFKTCDFEVCSLDCPAKPSGNNGGGSGRSGDSSGSSLSSGAVAGIVIFVLLVLIAGSVVITGVIVLVYGYKNPTTNVGQFMIEYRPKARSLNKSAASYNVETGKTALSED